MGNQDHDNVSLNETTSLRDLERAMMKLLTISVPLLLSLFLFLLMLFVIPKEIGESIFVPGFLFSFVLTLVGIFFLAKSSIWRYYIYSIRILQRLSPPDPVITKDYAVTRHENTIIFTQRSGPGGMFFVSFTNSEQTRSQEIDVPRTFWKWNPVLHIEGLRVHNRKGIFSIPTPEGEILRGAAILLLLPVLGQSYILHVPEFSRNRLLAVADYVSLLASD